MSARDSLIPAPGQKWRSRDRRDDGLTVTVLEVSETHVYIERFNKTRIRLDRFHKDYIGPVDAHGAGE